MKISSVWNRKKGLNRIFPWDIFQNLMEISRLCNDLEVFIGLFRVFSEIFTGYIMGFFWDFGILGFY
jgi:hypothetical protein